MVKKYRGTAIVFTPVANKMIAIELSIIILYCSLKTNKDSIGNRPIKIRQEVSRTKKTFVLKHSLKVFLAIFKKINIEVIN